MYRSVVELALPEQLGEAARADPARDLHLPHALLGVDVALGHEQVVRVVGGDLEDAVDVAADGDRALQPGDLDRAGRLRAAPGR